MSVTVTVASKEALQAALRTAVPGMTIRLEPGGYGYLSLPDTFPSGVTLVAVNPESRPVYFDGMTLKGVDNLTFDEIQFDLDGPNPDVHLDDVSGLSVLGISRADQNVLSSFGTVNFDRNAVPTPTPDPDPTDPGTGTPDPVTPDPGHARSGYRRPDARSVTHPDPHADPGPLARPASHRRAHRTPSDAPHADPPTPTPPSGATITVSTLSELYSAMNQCSGGETILLNGGNYGTFGVSKWSSTKIDFPSDVTIASADPNNPAVFSGMAMQDANHIAFDGVVFDYDFKAGDPNWKYVFQVSNSHNITIRNSIFDGDVAQGVSSTADGYGYATGLFVRGSQNVTIDHNEFDGFLRGLMITTTDGVTVTNNEVHSMRSEGFNFAAVQSVTISDNYLHDFASSPNSGDHPDMIQFWTAGTNTATKDVVISRNVLDIGNGDWTQSIFIRNELVDTGKAGSSMFYQNLVIEDNVIRNAHLHGITVGETNGLVIRNNSVLHGDGRLVDGVDNAVEIPRINVTSQATNVSIVNNITYALPTASNGWTVANNLIAQDQRSGQPGYYDTLFGTSSQVDVNAGLVALSGGQIAGLGVGAGATRGVGSSSSLTSAAAQSFDPATIQASKATGWDQVAIAADDDTGAIGSGVDVHHDALVPLI